MLNPYALLAIVVFTVLNSFYWHAKGSNAADTRWTAKITAERLKATEDARAKEKVWQGVVDATSKAYLTRITGIRGNLAVALDGLRNRPERPVDLSAAARTDCAGGSGAELSRPDAEFLSREAARADEIRAGLEACYQYADAVKR